MAVQTFSKGWQFKQTDTEEWWPVARVPTNVHLDLMDNKKFVPRVWALDNLLTRCSESKIHFWVSTNSSANG